MDNLIDNMVFHRIRKWWERHKVRSEQDIIDRLQTISSVDDQQIEMIDSVFKIDDYTIGDVMTPVETAVTVTPETNIQEFLSSSDGIYTRYPVVDSEKRAVGYIDLKDIVFSDDVTTVNDIIRDIPKVPETSNIDAVLIHLQNNNNQIAAVIDEWGDLEGFITIEDIIEVIVGDINDTFDKQANSPKIKKENEKIIVDAELDVDTVEDALGIEIEKPNNVQTIAGVVLHEIGEVPEQGETVSINSREYTVEETDKNRITKIAIHEDKS